MHHLMGHHFEWTAPISQALWILCNRKVVAVCIIDYITSLLSVGLVVVTRILLGGGGGTDPVPLSLTPCYLTTQ